MIVMPPTQFNCRAARLFRRPIYEVVINFLGKRPPSPGLEWGGGALCDTGLVAPQSFAARGIQSFPCLRAVIASPGTEVFYPDSSPRVFHLRG
jgi:hypothetical protein